MLSKGTPLAEDGSIVVDRIDGHDKHQRNSGEDGAGDFQVAGAADVGVEGYGGDGEDTSQKVAGPTVAARRGGGVWPVGADHVVDGGHVDGVVCDADDGAEDHAADPVEGRAGAGPGEADEAEGQAGGRVEEEPEAGFVLGVLIFRFGFALLLVAADGRDEDEPGQKIADEDGDEGEADLERVEAPAVLAVDEGEGLDEHKDEGVGEAGEEGEDQHDGFGHEHLEGPDPGVEDFLAVEAFAEGDHFVGAVDVGLLAALAALLGDLVHHDRDTGFGDGEEVDDLDGAAEDELDPDGPGPVEVLLGEAADDGTEDGAADGGEDDESDGVLLVVGFPHVGDHSQGDGATGGGQTAEGAGDHDGGDIGSERDGDLPDVDEEQGELQDGLAAEFFRPGRPQLATETIGDEEEGGAGAGVLGGDVEFLADAVHGVGVEGGVEVHADLDPKDDGQDAPFLPAGEAEAELVIAVHLVDLHLLLALGVVCAGSLGLFIFGRRGRAHGLGCKVLPLRLLLFFVLLASLLQRRLRVEGVMGLLQGVSGGWVH